MNYNNQFLITLDTDWAPDFVLKEVSQLFEEAGVKSTWFITNTSASLERLRKQGELFELGIHPNFMKNSSHGAQVLDVVKHMNSLEPAAVSNRMHGLVETWEILETIVQNTKIQIDSSVFLPFAENLGPVTLKIGGRELVRIPFVCGDDYELVNHNLNWKINELKRLNGIKIINFHPIHVYLNSSSIGGYQEIKNNLNVGLNEVQEEELEKYKNRDAFGVKTFLMDLLEEISKQNSYFVKDLIPHS